MIREQEEYRLKPDTLLQGRYRIERVIGEGGFGITYEAVNEKIGMTVAIKELYCREYIRRNIADSNDIKITYDSQREVFLQTKKRFLREARALSAFSGEDAIVKILDYFEENNTAYIVMHYLRGNTLEEELKKNGPMKWKDMLCKMKPIVQALEGVHNRGIVHRDISAGNIMILEDGSSVLVDFGTVKDTLRGEETIATTVFTKQGYTPIEQYAQNGNVGAWSDVYALCAVCYECLTGVRPPDSLQRAVYDEYKTVKEWGVEIPARLDEVLRKGLSVKAEDRYANMSELLKALENVENDGRKKKRKMVPILLISLVLAATAGIWLYFSYREEMMFRFEDTETFLVVREKDASMDAFEKDFFVMEERIKILTGEEKYIWEDCGESLRGVIPLKCFGGSDPKEILRDLVIRPGKWTINGVEIQEKYIREITFSDEEKNKLVIHLSDDMPEKIKEDLNGFENITLSMDYGYNNHVSLSGSREAPLSFSWNLKEKWPEENMRELFLYNLTHSGLDVVFSLYTQIQTEWENEENRAGFGEMQCSAEELTENTVYLEYGDEYAEDVSEGTVVDFVRSLKNRLDVLNIPYAVGREKNHEERVVICVNQRDYNETLFSLLLKDAGDFSIRDAWGRKLVDSYSFDEIYLEKEGKKEALISVRLESDAEKELAKTRKKQKGEKYYFMVNDIRLLEGDVSLWKGHTVSFHETRIGEWEKDEDKRIIFELLRQILTEQDVRGVYKLYERQYSSADDCVVSEPAEVRETMTFHAEEEESRRKEIEKLSENYMVNSVIDYEYGEEKLSVLLPYETYVESIADPSRMINRIFDIMTACGMEEGTPWSSITIGLDNGKSENSYGAKIAYYSGGEKKPYSIHVIAHEKTQKKWLQSVCEGIKSDNRFLGYEVEFLDYSEYYIY